MATLVVNTKSGLNLINLFVSLLNTPFPTGIKFLSLFKVSGWASKANHFFISFLFLSCVVLSIAKINLSIIRLLLEYKPVSGL